MKIEKSHEAVKKPWTIGVGGQVLYLTNDEIFHLREILVGMEDAINGCSYPDHEQQELLTEYPTSGNGWDLEV